MRTKLRILLLALPLAFAACSDFPDADPRPAAETISVSVGAGPKLDIVTESQTRTELGDNGKVRWATGDRIALWAVDSRQQTAVDGAVLTLWHYNTDYNTARFTGDVEAMAADTYTYYALSPVPVGVSGTKAVYSIPTVQEGIFDGSCDVMVAHPVEAPALESGDNSETVQFQFRHLVHVLKISIPKNNLGEEITEMTLTFPEPVTGHMAVDYTDPAAPPTLTGSANTLTLRFAEPKKPGDTVFAFIAPVELIPEQTVTITARGTTRQSMPREIAGKDFAAGHTTPIAYNIPAMGPTVLRFTLPDTGEATLGEKLVSFTLTAPEGCDLGEGSNVRTFAVNDAGNYDITFAEAPTALSGQPVTVAYESENALLRGSFTIPEIFAGATVQVATLRVPYLMEEDFSTLNADFSIHDNQATGVNIGSGTDSGYNDATDLSQYGLPSGWTAGRVGGQKGTSIRICGREEAGGKYPGRLDSAPLAGIKEGHAVTIRVSFNYSGNKIEYKGWGGKNGDPIYAYGYTTESGAFNGNTGLHNTVESNIVLSTEGSYTNIFNLKTFTLPDCGNTHRLSWQINTNKANALIQNGNYWLYLDNIKVSIAN